MRSEFLVERKQKIEALKPRGRPRKYEVARKPLTLADAPDVMTAAQMGELVGCSGWLILKEIEAGTIPAHRFGSKPPVIYKHEVFPRLCASSPTEPLTPTRRRVLEAKSASLRSQAALLLAEADGIDEDLSR